MFGLTLVNAADPLLGVHPLINRTPIVVSPDGKRTVGPYKNHDTTIYYAHGSLHKIFIEKDYLEDRMREHPDRLIEMVIGGHQVRSIGYPSQVCDTIQGPMYELDLIDQPLPVYLMKLHDIRTNIPSDKIWLLVDQQVLNQQDDIDIPIGLNDDYLRGYHPITNSKQGTLRFGPVSGMVGLLR